MHMHIGSQITDLAPFRNAFALLQELVARSARPGLRHRLRQSRRRARHSLSPRSAGAAAFRPTMRGSCRRKWAGSACRLLFEPGRMIAGNAGILVIPRALCEARRVDKTFTIVDAAMNDLMRPTLYEAYHEIVPVIEPAPGTRDASSPTWWARSARPAIISRWRRALPELKAGRSHFRDDGRRLWRGARFRI